MKLSKGDRPAQRFWDLADALRWSSPSKWPTFVCDHLGREMERVARSKRCRVAICAHEAAALTERDGDVC
jgi:hypothetical protein